MDGDSSSYNNSQNKRRVRFMGMMEVWICDRCGKTNESTTNHLKLPEGWGHGAAEIGNKVFNEYSMAEFSDPKLLCPACLDLVQEALRNVTKVNER